MHGDQLTIQYAHQKIEAKIIKQKLCFSKHIKDYFRWVYIFGAAHKGILILLY